MRKKRENGMAKESGMGDFPRKQFESVLLHSLRIMDQNREYLQMHLARTGDERTRQALEDMGQESIRLERTLREMMGLLEVEMDDKPSMKPVDLCWILMEAAQIAPEIEKQLGIRLTVDHSPFRRCYVKADAQEAEQLLFHLLSNAPLAGTMFPIEGSVELHTIHPALTTADGLRWQILRELALLSDKME